MTPFKERFPNERSLSEALRPHWPQVVAELQSSLGFLEAEYQRYKRQAIIAGVLLFTFIGVATATPLGFVWIGNEETIIGTFLRTLNLLLELIFVVYALYVIYMAISRHGALSEAIDAVLFPKVFAALGLSGEHTEVDTGEEKDGVLRLLDQSELVTEPRNTMNYDDSFTTSMYGRQAVLAELDIKHVTRRGKQNHTKNIFHGYFLTWELPRRLTGKTFVSSEGDKRGFGHVSFWNTVMDKGAQETELEWNDFENKLHVAATDPTEARYILTPDLMEDVYGWWQQRHENIRLAFIDNYFYVLFPSKQVRLSGISKLESEALLTYAQSITLPLLPILHLLDDIEDRFRS